MASGALCKKGLREQFVAFVEYVRCSNPIQDLSSYERVHIYAKSKLDSVRAY